MSGKAARAAKRQQANAVVGVLATLPMSLREARRLVRVWRKSYKRMLGWPKSAEGWNI